MGGQKKSAVRSELRFRGAWRLADIGESVLRLVEHLTIDAEIDHIGKVIVAGGLSVAIIGYRTALADERKDFCLFSIGSKPTIHEVVSLDMGVLREIHPHIDLSVVFDSLAENAPHTPPQRFFAPFLFGERIAVCIATPIGRVEQDTACRCAFLHPTKVGIVGLAHRGGCQRDERNHRATDCAFESRNDGEEERKNDISHKPISD